MQLRYTHFQACGSILESTLQSSDHQSQLLCGAHISNKDLVVIHCQEVLDDLGPFAVDLYLHLQLDVTHNLHCFRHLILTCSKQ